MVPRQQTTSTPTILQRFIFSSLWLFWSSHNWQRPSFPLVYEDIAEHTCPVSQQNARGNHFNVPRCWYPYPQRTAKFTTWWPLTPTGRHLYPPLDHWWPSPLSPRHRFHRPFNWSFLGNRFFVEKNRRSSISGAMASTAVKAKLASKSHPSDNNTIFSRCHDQHINYWPITLEKDGCTSYFVHFPCIFIFQKRLWRLGKV